MSSPTATAYTWDDFIALEDDDRRELIDGELVEVEVPNWRHERIVAMLCYFLTGWAKAGHGGDVVASGYKVRISERAGVMPDVQFYRKENVAPRSQEKGLVEGAPDLVVEIISPSSRRYDRVKKLRYYAGRGVTEYWIVDPYERGVERLVLRDGTYSINQESAHDEEVFSPASFEGLAIPLTELWS
jgi:Uma2 family endonuclease